MSSPTTCTAFHPEYPLSDLEQIVAGIKALGYTFVSPASLPG